MRENQSILIISVKPKYARKILTGEKTIELRKSTPKKIVEKNLLFLYVTAPVKEIWGVYEIEKILKDTPESFWELYGNKTGISETVFKNYFLKSKNAYGIQLKEVKKLANLSIKLSDLKKVLPNFMPPQTYSYIDSDIINYKFLKELIL